jgi:hypothetical protein
MVTLCSLMCAANKTRIQEKKRDDAQAKLKSVSIESIESKFLRAEECR